MALPGGPGRYSAAVTTSFLVLDIETVLDPELPIVQSDVERLPSPPHHKVVVLGALLFDAAYEAKRINVISELKDEAGILEDFARMLEERRPCLVTFNGRGFDIAATSGGRGLRHLSRRAASLHGSIVIDSQLGIGTTVRLLLPMATQAA